MRPRCWLAPERQRTREAKPCEDQDHATTPAERRTATTPHDCLRHGIHGGLLELPHGHNICVLPPRAAQCARARNAATKDMWRANANAFESLSAPQPATKATKAQRRATGRPRWATSPASNACGCRSGPKTCTGTALNRPQPTDVVFRTSWPSYSTLACGAEAGLRVDRSVLYFLVLALPSRTRPRGQLPCAHGPRSGRACTASPRTREATPSAEGAPPLSHRRSLGAFGVIISCSWSCASLVVHTHTQNNASRDESHQHRHGQHATAPAISERPFARHRKPYSVLGHGLNHATCEHACALPDTGACHRAPLAT